jgi:hypothetical protein
LLLCRACPAAVSSFPACPLPPEPQTFPPSQEAIEARGALETERSRAGESSGLLERQAAEHAAALEALQAQLAAALKSTEGAEDAAKHHTFQLAAAYRRADAAAEEAARLRSQLEEARAAAAAAQAAAASEAASASDAARAAEEARGDAERRLAEAQRARDALQAQLEALLARAAAAGEGGADLPAAPTGAWRIGALGHGRAPLPWPRVNPPARPPPHPRIPLQTAPARPACTPPQARACWRRSRQRAQTASTWRAAWRS